MARLPHFFIAGAPKAGTTSLYHYLDQHPQIYMSAIKEPHYFASEVRTEHLDEHVKREVLAEAPAVRAFLDGPMVPKRFGGTVTEWSDYLRLFANAHDGALLGEASVCYLWSPTAPGAIAARVPAAKAIVMLRDPAERAYAQYLHGATNGAIRWGFREHVERGLRHTAGPLCVYRPFLEFGMYAAQVRRWREVFGANLWIGFYQDFRDRPLDTVRKICRFLGVDDGFAPDMRERHLASQAPRVPKLGWLKSSGLWRAASRVTPAPLRRAARAFTHGAPMKIDPRDRAFLRDYYREDTKQLAALTGRELTAWLE